MPPCWPTPPAPRWPGWCWRRSMRGRWRQGLADVDLGMAGVTLAEDSKYFDGLSGPRSASAGARRSRRWPTNTPRAWPQRGLSPRRPEILRRLAVPAAAPGRRGRLDGGTRTPAHDHAARAEALDPSRSFLVQAPAGSGKTELLTDRILALLATVNRPEEIVAITFTRKAASEMHARVLSKLRRGRDPCPRPCTNAAAGNWRTTRWRATTSWAGICWSTGAAGHPHHRLVLRRPGAQHALVVGAGRHAGDHRRRARALRGRGPRHAGPGRRFRGSPHPA